MTCAVSQSGNKVARGKLVIPIMHLNPEMIGCSDVKGVSGGEFPNPVMSP